MEYYLDLSTYWYLGKLMLKSQQETHVATLLSRHPHPLRRESQYLANSPPQCRLTLIYFGECRELKSLYARH